MPTLGRGYAWLMILCWLLAACLMRLLSGITSKELMMVLLRSGLKRITFSLYRSIVKFSLLMRQISFKYFQLSSLSSSITTFSSLTSTFNASILPRQPTAIGIISCFSLLTKDQWLPTSSSNSSSRRLMTRNYLKEAVSCSGVAWKRYICPDSNSITSRESSASERRADPSKFNPLMRYSMAKQALRGKEPDRCRQGTDPPITPNMPLLPHSRVIHHVLLVIRTGKRTSNNFPFSQNLPPNTGQIFY